MLTFNPILKCGPDLTKKGIDVFLSGYHKKINYLGEQNTQVFIKKNINVRSFQTRTCIILILIKQNKFVILKYILKKFISEYKYDFCCITSENANKNCFWI
jgi:hypothetical protein